ncbi:MAG: hypothetical protein LBI82_01975 [Dysgonamonadaceae bacterium]|jgi:hypothetical protein|nr:hypothetical protein [Dysgonamonadaceae bacterium]
MAYIRFPNRELRDNFYNAVNNAKTDSGDWLMKSNVGIYSDDYISYDRENVRDFGQFGEFMQMFKGKLE